MEHTPYYIANAFTIDRFGGNPAAVLLVKDMPDDVTMLKVAKNLNQPMAAFVRASWDAVRLEPLA